MPSRKLVAIGAVLAVAASGIAHAETIPGHHLAMAKGEFDHAHLGHTH